MVISDIASYLEAKQVAKKGENLFVEKFPGTPSECIALFETQGGEFHNSGAAIVGMKVVARFDENYEAMRQKLEEIDGVLKKIGDEEDSFAAFGETINGRKYFRVTPEFYGVEQLETQDNSRQIAKNYLIMTEEK